jgi:pimeloyl-ACP methyl ester carboxylesterase
MSLGGRVALEAALEAPELFGGVVCVAPYLPWRRHTWMLPAARFLNPEFAEKIPLERIWPLLKRVAESIEAREELEHDWLARAGVRVMYYASCAATRAAFISAARELALDPGFGPDGTWTRLRGLELPASFLWCGRDALIPADHGAYVAQVLPRARQLELACSGHFVHGRHYRCFNHAISDAVGAVLDARNQPRRRRRRAPIQCECLADLEPSDAVQPETAELVDTAC